MPRRQALLVLGFIATIFVLGGVVRSNLPIELSVESVQEWVSTLHWKGPVLYLVLLTFRQFLLLPSAILLPVAGLCFGALFGTVLGWAGIILSGMLKFGLARRIRNTWGESPTNANLQGLIARVNEAGPVVISMVTAHPIGPMVPLHWAAGFSAIPLGQFLLALILGGFVRAAAFACLGSTLLGSNPIQFYAACLGLLAVILIPFAHPGLRRRLITVRSRVD